LEFYESNSGPSEFKLPTEEHQAVKKDRKDNSILVDFGKETFGFVKMLGVKGKGKVTLYYGESKEEAMSLDHGELVDEITVDQQQKRDITMEGSRAFRYVNISLMIK
jgi:alpha-L-rhamnosidase